MAELIWVAPEFEYRSKEPGWYWRSVILAVLLVALAIWQRNFLFGFFIVIAEVLLLVWAAQEPRYIQFHLSHRGLKIGNEKFHPLGEIDHFSVDEMEHKDLADIHLFFRARFKTSLRIHVPKENLDQVRKIFSISAPEVEHEDTLMDSLEHFFRF